MKIFFFVLCVPVYAMATKVLPCSRPAKPYDADLSDRVQVGNCKAPPCLLEKGKTIDVVLKFKAREEITSLRTSVYAKISQVSIPFIGVNGGDACKDIYDKEGKEKVDCSNIKIGEDYTYKHSIVVEPVYPEINTEVTWGLVNQNKQYVICFRVKAKIVRQ